MERQLYIKPDDEERKRAREFLRRKPPPEDVPFEVGLANIRRMREEAEAAVDAVMKAKGLYDGQKTRRGR